MGQMYSMSINPNYDKKNIDYYKGVRFFKIPNIYYPDQLGVVYYGDPYLFDSYLLI